MRRFLLTSAAIAALISPIAARASPALMQGVKVPSCPATSPLPLTTNTIITVAVDPDGNVCTISSTSIGGGVTISGPLGSQNKVATELYDSSGNEISFTEGTVNAPAGTYKNTYPDGFYDGAGCTGSVTSQAAFCTITNTEGADYATVFMTSVGTSNQIAPQGSWDGGTTWVNFALQDSQGASGLVNPNFTGDLSASRGYVTVGVAPQMRLNVGTYGSGTVAGYLVLKRGSPMATVPSAMFGIANAGSASGNSLPIGGTYRATPSIYTNLQHAELAMGTNGETLVNIDGVPTTSDWTNTVSLSSNTNTLIHGACTTGLDNYLDGIQETGLSTTTAVTLSVNDNVTALVTYNISGTAQQVNIPEFRTPPKGTAATAMNVQLSGSPTGAVQVNTQGHCGPP